MALVAAFAPMQVLSAVDTKMNPLDAEKEFLAMLQERGASLEALRPESGVASMVAFFRDVRAAGVRMDEDGDMLLFQWGCFEPDAFTYNITRQLIFDSPEEEDDIWQLQLSFYFEPSLKLKSLRSGHRWCHSLAELPSLISFIDTNAATSAIGGEKCLRRSLTYWSVE